MPKLYLASGSPRRKQLMSAAGYEFAIVIPDVDESPLKNEAPKKMVQRLSMLKAMKACENIDASDYFVLAADTTVVSPSGKNLGKPESLNDAAKMLKQLQGKVHSVYTAYTILRVSQGKTHQHRSRVIETKVTFRPLKKSEIDSYLACGESMDKAGAYAAQGAGVALVEKMNGSYTNVVGLPLTQVIADFKSLGLAPNGK